jgi:hypothetical protein
MNMPISTKDTALKTARRAIFILLGLSIAAGTNAPAQELEFVGSCSVPGAAAAGIYVNGDFAYVADYFSGLQIIQITDPVSPVIVATYDMENAYDVAVEGDYAYVAGARLEIINVGNPLNPIYVGSYLFFSNNTAIRISGDYAYLGKIQFFEIIDVSDPAAPYQAGYYDFDEWTCFITGVYISGDYAYTAANTSGLGCNLGRCSFDILNISDPGAPVLVSSLYVSEPYAVSVAGRYAYLGAFNGPGFRIVDIADPANPVIVGNYDLSSCANVFVADCYAYTAHWGAGVYMINIADPANPTTVAIYNTPYDAWDIYVVGEYVYVADGTSFIILRFVNVPCEGAYIPGDCDSNGYPLQLADVMAMIGLYRGTALPVFTCDCSPHGHIFAPQADPNGNCVAYELGDVVTEIAAYRGLGTVSGCPDCPPME